MKIIIAAVTVAVCLAFTVTATAQSMDFNKMSTDQLYPTKQQGVPKDQRADFRSEWNNRVLNMTPEQMQKYRVPYQERQKIEGEEDREEGTPTAVDIATPHKARLFPNPYHRAMARPSPVPLAAYQFRLLVVAHRIAALRHGAEMEDGPVDAPHPERTVFHSAGHEYHAASCNDMLLVLQPEFHLPAEVVRVLRVVRKNR